MIGEREVFSILFSRWKWLPMDCRDSRLILKRTRIKEVEGEIEEHNGGFFLLNKLIT